MLDVGIIGLGPHWESTYQPALKNLRDRIRVRVIYDAVSSRAQPSAMEFQAAACCGILDAMALRSVQAVLILDDGWSCRAVVSFLLQQNKPAFIAELPTILGSAPTLIDFASAAPLPMIVPGLDQRYTPATSRLRELMATRLGAAAEITVTLPAGSIAALDERIPPMIDWCRYLTGTPVAAIQSTAEMIEMQFHRSKSGAEPAQARFVERASDDPSSTDKNPPAFSAVVRCQRGTATLTGTRTITWTHSDLEHTETLEGERDAAVVLLDLFCRRAIGGLVPIPTIDDALLAAALTEEISEKRSAD